MTKVIRVGTRGSKLALIQTQRVIDTLSKRYPEYDIKRQIIKTKGDLDQVSTLSEIGGKGVFIRELEYALLREEIDIAVHSLKDITTTLEPGLCLAAYLTPEAIEDVWIYGKTIHDESQVRRVGTGSLRRKGLLQKTNPELDVLPIRGNVDTRIEKCDRGEYDAILCSKAGILRLGLEKRIAKTVDKHTFLPAPGQGVITIECRKEDPLKAIVETLSDPIQARISEVETAFIQALNFGCDNPLGLLTTVNEDKLQLKSFLADPELTCYWEDDILLERSVTQDQVQSYAQSLMKRTAKPYTI